MGRARWRPYEGTKIVTFHDSWPNFAKRFELVVAGHLEPKPGIPPTPSHTLEIINLIQSQKIPVILIEPYFDSKTPNSSPRRRARRWSCSSLPSAACRTSRTIFRSSTTTSTRSSRR